MLALPASADRYAVVMGNCGHETTGEIDNNYPSARLCCEALVETDIEAIYLGDSVADAGAAKLRDLVDRVQPGDEVILVYLRRSAALRDGLDPEGVSGTGRAPVLNRAVAVRDFGGPEVIAELERAGARITVEVLDGCSDVLSGPDARARSATALHGDAPTPVSEGTLPIYTIEAWEYALDNIYDVLPGNMHSVVSRLFLSHHHIITAIGPETFSRGPADDIISRAFVFVAIRDRDQVPEELAGITIRQNIRQNVVPEIIIEGTGPTDLFFPIDFPPRLGPPPRPNESQALDTPAPLDPARPGTPGTGPAAFDTALGTAQDPVTPGTSQALDTPAPRDPARPGTPGTGPAAFDTALGTAPDPLAPGTSQALDTP
ncbi:hypothetical protein, partial [Roseovarius ramblicola]